MASFRDIYKRLLCIYTFFSLTLSSDSESFLFLWAKVDFKVALWIKLDLLLLPRPCEHRHLTTVTQNVSCFTLDTNTWWKCCWNKKNRRASSVFNLSCIDVSSNVKLCHLKFSLLVLGGLQPTRSSLTKVKRANISHNSCFPSNL